MNGLTIIEASGTDRAAIRSIEEAAFGQPGEADLVDALVAESEDALELVATLDGVLVGHLLFSTLLVETANRSFSAVALAPLAVHPDFQRRGVGTALVEESHRRLRAAGEGLSVVLGDPGYYGRFGYSHERAAGFDSDYQCDALQALAWSREAPLAGRLVYALPFSGL
jgi:putative acetyltransferase